MDTDTDTYSDTNTRKNTYERESCHSSESENNNQNVTTNTVARASYGTSASFALVVTASSLWARVYTGSAARGGEEGVSGENGSGGGG